MLRNGTNGYSDNRSLRLAREIRPMRVYMLCTTTLHSVMKTEHFCQARQSLQTLHCAVDICFPQRRA